MAHPETTTDYTSPSADTTSFSATSPAKWIQCCVGAGTVVMLDNSATPVSKTYVFTGGEVIRGEWTALVSTTCTRIRIGTSNEAASAIPTSGLPVNLGGGNSNVTGTLPASNVQDWGDSGTIYTVAFIPTPGNMHPFNYQVTGNINFPKITALIAGQPVALINVGTGATASTLVPTGTDSMGAVAAGVTAATAAGPKSLVAQRYTPNLTLGQWVPSI